MVRSGGKKEWESHGKCDAPSRTLSPRPVPLNPRCAIFAPIGAVSGPAPPPSRHIVLCHLVPTALFASRPSRPSRAWHPSHHRRACFVQALRTLPHPSGVDSWLVALPRPRAAATNAHAAVSRPCEGLCVAASPSLAPHDRCSCPPSCRLAPCGVTFAPVLSRPNGAVSWPSVTASRLLAPSPARPISPPPVPSCTPARLQACPPAFEPIARRIPPSRAISRPPAPSPVLPHHLPPPHAISHPRAPFPAPARAVSRPPRPFAPSSARPPDLPPPHAFSWPRVAATRPHAAVPHPIMHLSRPVALPSSDARAVAPHRAALLTPRAPPRRHRVVSRHTTLSLTTPRRLRPAAPSSHPMGPSHALRRHLHAPPCHPCPVPPSSAPFRRLRAVMHINCAVLRHSRALALPAVPSPAVACRRPPSLCPGAADTHPRPPSHAVTRAPSPFSSLVLVE
ncbi:hypothetical protein DENSPDRAFT_887351 [Dentipellis sp. KUC8613]|nr:hypothetical protein DENSPDRAFT_887351 [Dentipellis sp. KUC8613]